MEESRDLGVSSKDSVPKNCMEDSDPVETCEWLESLESVLKIRGVRRCQDLLHRLLAHARIRGVEISSLLGLPYSNMNTPYWNTVARSEQPAYPGDLEIERRITAIVRWNALAMVVRANKESSELGGHLASYASVADLFEVGFNHFFHGDSGSSFGRQADLVLFQPHSAPGVYARAFLEGRLSEEQLANFRREVGGKGLSSYPHPWLMSEFWQFPTGSMGIGAITAIYQARFMRYMENRGLVRASHRRVWAFLGDGEMDEPESIGGLTLAARENLDNLTFVINCNLQRLDGPVRGNGSIVQELERLFVGAGWNVVKLLWGSEWDDLFARDKENLILQRLSETVDGQLQSYGAHDGKFNRERFFNKYPALAQLASTLSDQQLDGLSRGGHDPVKIHAAFDAAVRHSGRPTVILAQTKKGYGLGPSAESRMSAHQQKKLNHDALQSFRDRFSLPLSDDDVAHAAFYRPPPESPEMCYLRECRKKLGGFVPMRATKAQPVEAPNRAAFGGFAFEPVDREMSTTVAFVRMLTGLLKNDAIGRRVVPIIADEARTFGMQSLFRQAGIYSHCGQLYEPEDRDDFLFYKESRDGQILEEGISEAGALSSWIAAGTSYSHHGISMLPIYIFYSMFGFQRVGDLIWAAADSRTRGFLVGATAGRTTLSGEGLQHQDGTSHVSASMVPNCRAYDPCFAYELAVIVEHGLRAMLEEQEDVFYYITTMNENYLHPAMPEGAEEGIIQGMYLIRPAGSSERALRCHVQLLGSGAILREALAAAELLERDWDIGSDVWSVTSFTELRRAGLESERWNRLHLPEEPKLSWIEQCLGPTRGPVIAATDYVRALPDLIRTWVPRRYVTLGTDGFGRSDTRAALRSFFEVDSLSIAFAAITALVEEGAVSGAIASAFIDRYQYAPDGFASWVDRRDIQMRGGGCDSPDNPAGALAAEK
jgi:pyruvate dehydrogenase E1 component